MRARCERKSLRVTRVEEKRKKKRENVVVKDCFPLARLFVEDRWFDFIDHVGLINPQLCIKYTFASEKPTIFSWRIARLARYKWRAHLSDHKGFKNALLSYGQCTRESKVHPFSLLDRLCDAIEREESRRKRMSFSLRLARSEKSLRCLIRELFNCLSE